MLDRQERDAILAEVKKNNRKLKSCTGHDFSIDATPERPVFKKWRCSKCNGEVDSVAKSWYEDGVKHTRELLKEDIELANMYRGLCK